MKSAKSVIEAFQGAKVNILVQEFIKEADAADIRALVIGNRVVASMMRQGPAGEFRSNLHRGGFGGFGTRRLPMYCLRITFQYLAMVSLFYALANMQIADVFALQFTIPLFTALIAATAIGEKVVRARWLGMAVGFAGVLLIVRPGVEAIQWAALIAIAGTFCFGSSNVMVKVLTRTDDARQVVFYMQLMQALMALGPALYVWHTLALTDLPWILLLGVGGICRFVGAAVGGVVAGDDELSVVDGAGGEGGAPERFAEPGQAGDRRNPAPPLRAGLQDPPGRLQVAALADGDHRRPAGGRQRARPAPGERRRQVQPARPVRHRVVLEAPQVLPPVQHHRRALGRVAVLVGVR